MFTIRFSVLLCSKRGVAKSPLVKKTSAKEKKKVRFQESKAHSKDDDAGSTSTAKASPKTKNTRAPTIAANKIVTTKEATKRQEKKRDVESMSEGGKGKKKGGNDAAPSVATAGNGSQVGSVEKLKAKKDIPRAISPAPPAPSSSSPTPSSWTTSTVSTGEGENQGLCG